MIPVYGALALTGLVFTLLGLVHGIAHDVSSSWEQRDTYARVAWVSVIVAAVFFLAAIWTAVAV